MSTRKFYRPGTSHWSTEQGAPISFLDIRRQFDFRGIKIGAWVTEAEKLRAAPLFYNALCDLMTILGGNESLISLRGTLALQYGSGGEKGVNAHYELGARTFALAKNAGPGSMAHEWFHAFDHYIGAKLFVEKVSDDFASCAWLKRPKIVEHPLNKQLVACYRTILLDETGTKPNDYVKRSKKYDRTIAAKYFGLPEELCARAFEAFIQDAAIKNMFLVKGTVQSEEAKLGLYPEGQHRLRINAAFSAYFGQLGAALKR
ncbi:hypothetical protein QWY82_11785 [Simiduia curdlanivorans]|uniref:CLCA_X family protein n=1 Tax=Simiduia curdlanivorans TaxID=1492769 RepID=A0ABV8V8E0_9GAMM|nr:CLCA_X family protein [Simiduia curdlanivorans]MDN3639485.1 hypothetical protein [Simiduia curdlanivorans]